ncbi:MAG: hypothetical protein U0M42_05985 [Acutalibacteraceae bacterium]|nr:hypothetical protein [Acutalibacteraceae bacterium]
MSLKKVLLIGDSIRMGYDKYVKDYLKDSCEVYFPTENCRFAQYVLRCLSDWRKELKIGEELDLIHWNAGLWDTLEQYEDGCLTPPKFYEYFIDRICNRIKILFPKAKVIFATSTPILECKIYDPKIFTRKNDKIREYNDIAVNVCKKYGFEINDLYSVVENVPELYYSDMTHLYTPEGTQLLTDAVVKKICEVLEIEYKEFTLVDYQNVKEVIGI